MTDFADELGSGYLNLVVRRLGQRLASGGDAYLRHCGSGVPARATAILAYIARHDRTPIVNIAEALGYTHPAVAKVIDQFEQAELVQSNASDEDLRRRCVSLTRLGRSEAKKIDQVAERAALVFEAMYEEIGVNLFEAIRRFEVALDQRPLAGRLQAEDPPTRRAVKRPRKA